MPALCLAPGSRMAAATTAFDAGASQEFSRCCPQRLPFVSVKARSCLTGPVTLQKSTWRLYGEFCIKLIMPLSRLTSGVSVQRVSARSAR
jgi:hypothetical protein